MALIWKYRIHSPSLFLFFPKDTSGGDSCTSEEEPTFDPGYEPDWAVISTVRPRPRHSEPTRGSLRWYPWGRVVTHLTLSGHGSVGFTAHCQDGRPALASQSQESGWGCRLSPAQVQHGQHLQGLQPCSSCQVP